MDMHCKDKSGRCMTISVNSCKMPILAEVCKRSCGLCNGGQLQVLPPFPFHLQGKPLHTTLLCCDFNIWNRKYVLYSIILLSQNVW